MTTTVHKVKLFGNLSRESVQLEAAKSKVFMITSKYEKFGVVEVEALGKPVIATKCGGPKSIINEKVEVLVSVDSTDEIALAMIELYNHRDKYSAEDIREYCRNKFSEAAVMDKLTNIYSKCFK